MAAVRNYNRLEVLNGIHLLPVPGAGRLKRLCQQDDRLLAGVVVFVRFAGSSRFRQPLVCDFISPICL